MKRCPTCDRTYDDAALSFCPHDGASLINDASSAPTVGLQATMLATPSSLGGTSNPQPRVNESPGSGSFNPSPPNQAWPNQQSQGNQSWAQPSTPQTAAPKKSGALNPKVLIGAGGCLLLVIVTVVVGLGLLYAMSGPASKMNPYKGDLKALAPESVGDYKTVDVDPLGDKDKKNLGKINEGLGVAYALGSKTRSDASVSMLLGNYSSAKDAEEGLKTFRDEAVRNGWSSNEVGSKKIGWRTVGIRFEMTREYPKSQNDQRYLPDDAQIVQAQASASPEKTPRHFTLWTNGSVIFLVLTEGDKWDDFEKVFDKETK